MSRIIEAFGYDECVRLSKYPDNCNFNLKTKEVKHENSTSTVGQFVGYVSVCEIKSAIAKYEILRIYAIGSRVCGIIETV